MLNRKIHTADGGLLCDGKDCLSHANGHHTDACIVRDSEGVAVDHDDFRCECDPTRKYLVLPVYARGER